MSSTSKNLPIKLLFGFRSILLLTSLNSAGSWLKPSNLTYTTNIWKVGFVMNFATDMIYRLYEIKSLSWSRVFLKWPPLVGGQKFLSHVKTYRRLRIVQKGSKCLMRFSQSVTVLLTYCWLGLHEASDTSMRYLVFFCICEEFKFFYQYSNEEHTRPNRSRDWYVCPCKVA